MRRPALGDPLPDTMRDHAGAIIFGGPKSANDADDFIKREIDWIGVPLREESTLSRHLPWRADAGDASRAARLRRIPRDASRSAIIRSPRPSTGHRVCKSSFPDHVYQWHREGFDCPRGATCWPTERLRTQAFRAGEAYGFQFHPEVTYAMMCRWTGKAGQRMVAPGARERHHHLEGWYMHDAKVACWTEEFLRCWLRSGERDATGAHLVSDEYCGC